MILAENIFGNKSLFVVMSAMLIVKQAMSAYRFVSVQCYFVAHEKKFN
jgi:hypothetical protein